MRVGTYLLTSHSHEFDCLLACLPACLLFMLACYSLTFIYTRAEPTGSQLNATAPRKLLSGHKIVLLNAVCGPNVFSLVHNKLSGGVQACNKICKHLGTSLKAFETY